MKGIKGRYIVIRENGKIFEAKLSGLSCMYCDLSSRNQSHPLIPCKIKINYYTRKFECEIAEEITKTNGISIHFERINLDEVCSLFLSSKLRINEGKRIVLWHSNT